MADRLLGKTAVVTGAGSGIGRATALKFLSEGASVVAGVFEPGDGEALAGAADVSEKLEVVEADVSTDAGASRLVDSALRRFGKLDVLVNCAGIVVSGEALDTTEEEWSRVLDVNAKGTFLCCRRAIPELLRGGGSIVNVASINAIRGNHALVAYAASKGGVTAMTMAMALDYAARGVRVNCICPATIGGTRMVERGMEGAPDRAERERYLLAKHPMGRFGRPEEVAAAILFLASDEASFLTGVVLPVDGGRSIR